MAMNFQEFHLSLSNDVPPSELSLALTALWWDAKGDWAKAHQSAQEDESREGSWVHAYLHRKEGDQSNAEYWYQHAEKPTARNSLQMEWNEISASLLDQ